MHKFVRSLITEWRKLGWPFSDGTIVVAVSGGADSMSLLLAIHDLVKREKLKHRVIVAHLNHGLRGQESDRDERFVRDEAERLGFEFVVGSAQLAKKGNLEQAARNARYKFLSKVARENGAFAVLTGHTQNDQAETVLFNMIRGSGPDGLAGMRSVRELENGVLLIRPLVSWASRDATEDFCHQNKIKYRTDRMNSDEKFSRVRIRKDILPRLAEINPKIIQTLARTAEVMRRSSDASALAITPASANLVLKDLKALESADLYAAIRSWLAGNRGSLRALQLKHIEAIGRLILSPKSGNTIELPGGGRVVKRGGVLSFRNIEVEK
ncbi:MAG TPA: tRNA lysidine(34) synthetase TilS [Pyrinomonadaceae bacterium]|nr:tRNA lysidine(34) synthetase TilS [Pyrinomonadaceae bacterium]